MIYHKDREECNWYKIDNGTSVPQKTKYLVFVIDSQTDPANLLYRALEESICLLSLQKKDINLFFRGILYNL